MRLVDIRHVLPSIRVPTLVLHRKDIRAPSIPVEQGRYLAEHIPDAKFVLVPGVDAGIFVEYPDEILDHIEEFVTGVRGSVRGDRVLATVVFTDIVGSTGLAARFGDSRWQQFLEMHDEQSRAYVEGFRGRVVKSTGDGIVSTFEGPGRAIQCALSLTEGLRDSGIDIRAGLHTGEIELHKANDIGGITVHIAARVMAEAAATQVVVSRTVKDLVAGSGFAFDDLGVRTLRGVNEPWQLYAVHRT